jgi:hypothetical protein
VEETLQSGKLAQAVRHPEIKAAYAFDLGSDHETMHGPLSTLAAWYSRDPSSPPRRPGDPGGKPPIRGAVDRREPLRRVEVVTIKRRTIVAPKHDRS